MIQQFVALGKYFMHRDGFGGRGDQAEQYAQDPSKKFRSKLVYLLVFANDGFRRVQVEEFSAEKTTLYLYRFVSAQGSEATPTTGLDAWNPDEGRSFEKMACTKLARLRRSIDRALVLYEPGDDPQDVSEIVRVYDGIADAAAKIVSELKRRHTDPRSRATLSIGWEPGDRGPKRVGNYPLFRRALVHAAKTRFAGTKTSGSSEGEGQCSICGTQDVRVVGNLQVFHPPFYTLDKLGSVSGGFDKTMAWRNFPACDSCCEAADYAGKCAMSELRFSFHGFKYLVLPLPAIARESEAFALLKRLTSARMSKKAIRLFTDREDEISYVISEEQNLVQFDLVFYRPEKSYFRPALYVSGVLPSHFQKLFAAKARVDAHPWFAAPSPKTFAKGGFTFGAFRRMLPAAHGGSTFDDDFLDAVRCALELRAYPRARLLAMGMRWVQQGFAGRGRVDESLLADLTRTLLFFDAVAGVPVDTERGESMSADIYGNKPQADRVRAFFQQAPGTLHSDPAAQAAFLIGACCKRIMDIQDRVREARPFLGKLKGLRLNEADLKRLLPEAIDKAEAYGDDNRRAVATLLECAGAAMVAAGDGWRLSADEVSYYFALGLVLAPRLAA